MDAFRYCVDEDIHLFPSVFPLQKIRRACKQGERGDAAVRLLVREDNKRRIVLEVAEQRSESRSSLG